MARCKACDCLMTPYWRSSIGEFEDLCPVCKAMLGWTLSEPFVDPQFCGRGRKNTMTYEDFEKFVYIGVDKSLIVV